MKTLRYHPNEVINYFPDGEYKLEIYKCDNDLRGVSVIYWTDITNILTDHDIIRVKDNSFHSYDDKPSWVTNGYTYWHKNGDHHRDNGPAIIRHDGENLYYFKDGVSHRDDGPAFISRNNVSFFIHGKNIMNEVDKWKEDNNIPEWSKWTDAHKVLFKLTFG